ncbi:MAG: putative 6-oxocyclohex-ene-carbonyl-CoA hydrolase [Myxococcaceae bacterium]|nr:putative 6-oxocyclohex-ene-carbonyl-CoA hydrolase [Myxococcaceae bacterium]
MVPALKVDGKFVPNPLVECERYVDPATGKIVYGDSKEGEALARGKAILAKGTVDLTLLDEAVDRLCAKLLLTFPECTVKTLESMRKKKLEHWDLNKESNRAWLAGNMMTEARAGFCAFHYGEGSREIDFVGLRRRLAQGEVWSEALHEAIAPEGARPSQIAKKQEKAR